MSAAAIVLPCVWAFADLTLPVAPVPPPEPNLAFYRKYTHALLRRYVRMSMEAGKVPSLLGQEMLRGKVSSYRVESFEDVVIFLHDIEHCLEKLTSLQQNLVTRIALQEFTADEVAAAIGMPSRSVLRYYGQALDSLTRIFLSVEILAPLKHCQGGKS